MKPDIKEKWVKALRSDEYPQTKSTLKDSDGFCCLGVLCDLYLKETDQQWEIKQTYTRTSHCHGRSTVLPKQVREWAGLTEADPVVTELADKPLSFFNDDADKNFSEIADIIDRYF